MEQLYRSAGRNFFVIVAVAALIVGCDDEPTMAPADMTPGPAFAGGAAQEKMVFASDQTGNQDIWISNGDVAAGYHLKKLVNWPGSVEVEPALSPDGRYVAYASDMNSAFGIHVVSTDGLTGWSIAPWLAGDQSRPVWSPDSKRIAFASDHTGNAEIFVSTWAAPT